MRTFDYASFETTPIPGEVKMYLSLIKEYKGKLQDIYMRKPGTLSTLIHYAALRGAASSNRMEGISTSDRRLEPLLDGRVKPVGRAEKEILGYKFCLDLMRKNHEKFTFTPGYILRLHKHLYRYAPTVTSGLYKSMDTVNNAISVECGDGGDTGHGIKETLNDEIIRPSCGKKFDFVPVSALDTEQAVRDLCDAYNLAMERNAVSSLILSTQFVMDFLCIQPFYEGNGRMSRLLLLMLMYQNDYRSVKCISLEEMMEKTKDSYCEALRASTINWQDGTNDPWPFISYMLGITLAAYRELENRFI